MQFGFYFDQTRCTGCFTCCVSCKDWHDTPPGRANWIRLAYLERGEFPHPFISYFPTACYHCADPICLAACPEGAIRKEETTGAVIVDRDVCTGCKTIPETLIAEKANPSPCTANCPAHINVQGFVGLSEKEKYSEALKLIKEENPFPAVCGRVCHHPCEKACNRGDIDDSVSIKALHRYLADLDLKRPTPYIPKINAHKNEKVAIIGSGPTGLTCAYYLAKEGYSVTVFEKLEVVGGMMAVGIPEYRLPRNIVAGEVDVIKKMGVTLNTGVTFGKDITLESLKADGYAALFMATGLHGGRRLGVNNENAKGVIQGVDFLRDVALGKEVSIGESVIVIGGGNVAIDTALTAKRKGAKEVTLVSLEKREEMPAWEHEIQEAMESDIRIVNCFGPKDFFIDKAKRVSGLECKACTAVFDADGRFNPKYDENQCEAMFADTVIVAIGQSAELDLLREQGVPVTGMGLDADRTTLQTSLDWVFAGGDALHGPKSVVEAVAAGKEASISISRYLRGVDLREGRDRDWSIVAKVQTEQYHAAKRVKMPEIKLEDRLKSFNEIQLGLPDDMIVEEAKRCLSCGYSCSQSCPYGAPQFGDETGAKMQKCDFCSDKWPKNSKPICVEACPTRALDAGPLEELREKYGQGADSAGFAWSAKTGPSIVIRPKVQKS